MFATAVLGVTVVAAWAGLLTPAPTDPETLALHLADFSVTANSRYSLHFHRGESPLQWSWIGERGMAPGPAGERHETVAVAVEGTESDVRFRFVLDADTLEPIGWIKPNGSIEYPGQSWPQDLETLLPFALFQFAGQELAIDEPRVLDIMGFRGRIIPTGQESVGLSFDFRSKRRPTESVTYEYEIRDGLALPHRVTRVGPTGNATVIWDVQSLRRGPTIHVASGDAGNRQEVWDAPRSLSRKPYERWPPAEANGPFPFPVADAVRLSKKDSPLRPDDPSQEVRAFFEEHPNSCMVLGRYIENLGLSKPGTARPQAGARYEWRTEWASPAGPELGFTVARYGPEDPAKNESIAWEVYNVRRNTSWSAPCPSAAVVDQPPAMVPLDWFYRRCIEQGSRDVTVRFVSRYYGNRLMIGGVDDIGVLGLGCNAAGSRLAWDAATGFRRLWVTTNDSSLPGSAFEEISKDL